MPFDFWSRWLLAVGYVLIVFGLALALFNQSPFFDMAFNRQIDPAFWPSGEVPAGTAEFQSWIYGVLGATVAGWGVFLAFIAGNSFAARERWAWNCVFCGITLWFLADSAISGYFSAWFNVAFNGALAVLVYVPLIATRKHFKV